MTLHASAWPRQLRLPGQAAAPEGPIDLRTMYVMHHAFRRDLDLFAAAVRGTPVDARATWALLAERWELLTSVLHEHHAVEDAGLWPALAELGSDADRDMLRAMESEHGEIDPLLAGCAAGFDRLAQCRVAGADDVRAALAVRVLAVRESLRRHLAHEETEALAMVQRLLDPEAWSVIAGSAPRPRLARLLRVVPWAAYGVPREVLDRAFDEPGGRALWAAWRLGRRRFGRRHAATFRYA